ncbi:hypothetical protein A1O3_07645 [Capronia epimyces CBS 606.96]|uniref:R3H domain-containing protein n=1 Tax=Capronia epimyces CBS 606.96 TaxID=1182542 RepID=W9XVL4_9EURO|nr:uncharacterized protein A1O3_07645 [Capronia epimyces CBS 606.96]EXJ81355.1 hypothetical protein A1O3_07645 [Capronia epimyces CBS 606.96]
MITCDCQRKKEEVRCNARAHMPESSGRQTCLKCDEECARLERNRSLALALHIADDHIDDHVPYSTTTLKMYLDDMAWAHKQEEILRLFAADDARKRYAFQPMKSQQRAFIHSIAEDFGFDGESLDPEPYRHVVLFKTPKFVAAPMKTLAQAVRVKRGQLNVSAAALAPRPEHKADEVKHDYNGLLLLKPKFALTEDEVRPVLKKSAATTDFDIIFLPNDEGVALIPSRSWDTPEQMDTLLTSLRPIVANEVIKHKLASSVVLGRLDRSGSEVKVVQQQGKASTTVSNGWSQVAAKKAPAAQAAQTKPVGQRPMYTVLGSRLAEAKRKKENEERLRRKAQQQDVVDDWEQEVEREEDNEAGAGRRASEASQGSKGSEGMERETSKVE